MVNQIAISGTAEAVTDRRSARRAARRAENRIEILDAAERVFASDGIRDGSLRAIAAQSGFSTAGIYLFFENKQHLLAEVLTRRGDELVSALRQAGTSEAAPLEQLHEVVDVTAEFFAERPDFRLLLRQIRGGATITGPVLAEYAGEVDARFGEAMDVLADIVRRGQALGQIRRGDPHALAHLFSVLVNEYVLMGAAPLVERAPMLASDEFHVLIDGALGATGASVRRKGGRSHE